MKKIDKLLQELEKNNEILRKLINMELDKEAMKSHQMLLLPPHGIPSYRIFQTKIKK